MAYRINLQTVDENEDECLKNLANAPGDAVLVSFSAPPYMVGEMVLEFKDRRNARKYLNFYCDGSDIDVDYFMTEWLRKV